MGEDEMKEYVLSLEKDRLYRELGENREFQEWKRECKQVEKIEDLKYIQEVYRDHQEFAQWQTELQKSIQEEKKAIIVEHFEMFDEEKERRANEKLILKSEEADKRNLQRQIEMDHQQRELAKEKEALLRSLELTRARQSVPVGGSKSTSRL